MSTSAEEVSALNERLLWLADRWIDTTPAEAAVTIGILLARASQAEQERDAWVVLHDLVKAERDRLRTALERTLANFERVVARVPVRDVTETIAEARAALGSTTEPEEAAR